MGNSIAINSVTEENVKQHWRGWMKLRDRWWLYQKVLLYGPSDKWGLTTCPSLGQVVWTIWATEPIYLNYYHWPRRVLKSMIHVKFKLLRKLIVHPILPNEWQKKLLAWNLTSTSKSCTHTVREREREREREWHTIRTIPLLWQCFSLLVVLLYYQLPHSSAKTPLIVNLCSNSNKA